MELLTNNNAGGSGTAAPAESKVAAAGAAGVAATPMTLSLDSLDADLRGNKTIAGLAGQPVDKALRMLVAAEGLVGKKGVVLPTGPDDKAGREAYRKAIGVPEAPDKYPAPQLPQGVEVDAAMDKQVRELGIRLGWTPEQYTGFVAELVAINQAEQANAKKDRETALETARAQMRTAWGTKYDSNVQLANNAAAAFAGEKDLAELKDLGLLDHPTFLRLMAKVGEAVSPDRLTSNRQGAGDGGEAAIARRIDEMMRSPAYTTERGPAHGRVLEEIMQLRKQLTAAK